MRRKAEMGVGTLIIFIALLLVAAVAAGVLITTAGTLQEKALATGKQATSQISTHAEVVEVSAINGSTGVLTNFSMVIRLSPGSDKLQLGNTTMIFSTFNTTTTLIFLEPRWRLAGVSSAADGTMVNITYCDLNGSQWSNTSGQDVGENIFNGTAKAGCAQSDITSQTGNYTAEYLQKGANWMFGLLQKGDVIRIYFESPRDVISDEDLRVSFIPKVGSTTLTKTTTPDVISANREYLYP